jgi:oleandomycin transport system ATP-binding protein
MVRIDDRDAIGQAFRRLDEADIAVDDLSLRRPSLDEVFLAVTGHVADDDGLEDDASVRTDERRGA